LILTNEATIDLLFLSAMNIKISSNYKDIIKFEILSHWVVSEKKIISHVLEIGKIA
jgi:hypothetical protein